MSIDKLGDCLDIVVSYLDADDVDALVSYLRWIRFVRRKVCISKKIEMNWWRILVKRDFDYWRSSRMLKWYRDDWKRMYKDYERCGVKLYYEYLRTLGGSVSLSSYGT